MVCLIGLVALVSPVFGGRVSVHSGTGSLVGQLSAADSVTANRGFHLLSMLKENPEDVELQHEYRDIIGDVDWEESKVFLETGAKIEQAQVLLGQMTSNVSMVMAELVQDAQTQSRVSVAIGRLITGRRDYIVEDKEGETRYIIDGVTMSLHSRMHVSVPGEDNPRFVLRRAFNYLNPVAGIVGQFVYRVIACREAALNNGACNEGEILYTITKDRIGKGFLWGKDEYRVYIGTGGCKRSGHGVLSCHQSDQVMYSLSAGINDGTHDTQYYKGNIIEIYGNGQSGVVYEQLHTLTNGASSPVNQFVETKVSLATLEGMKVASITKVAGPPRWLNWPVMLLGGPVGGVFEFAKSLVWADAYQMESVGGGGDVDDLLLSLMAAAQDLTRDFITNTHSIVR